MLKDYGVGPRMESQTSERVGSRFQKGWVECSCGKGIVAGRGHISDVKDSHLWSITGKQIEVSLFSCTPYNRGRAF